MKHSKSVQRLHIKVPSKLNATQKAIGKLTNEIHELGITIRGLRRKLYAKKDFENEYKTVSAEINKLQKRYDSNNWTADGNKNYQYLLKRKVELSNKLANWKVENGLIERIEKISNILNEKRSKLQEFKKVLSLYKREQQQRKEQTREIKTKRKEEKSKNRIAKIKSKTTSSSTQSNHANDSSSFIAKIETNNTYRYDVDWDCISFDDGCIKVQLGTRKFDDFALSESRRSLNVIKPLYRFRHAPKLHMQVVGNKIVRIVNIDVLFYYIRFLSFSDSFNRNLLNTQVLIRGFKNYSKKFYQTYLPDIFLPRCFNYLCQFCLEHLPIVPIPEMVKHNTGKQEVHDSFLFPVKEKKGIYWIWESIEESKASYVFKTTSEKDLQQLFDYLTGNATNKRENLIHNTKLSKALHLQDRFLHTDESHWKECVELIRE